MTWVDVRYEGNHGIARYANEVLPRLKTPLIPYRGRMRPGKPLDLADPMRWVIPAGDLLYSPGYSAGWARCAQLITLHDLTHLREASALRRSLNRGFYATLRRIIIRTGHVITVSDTSVRDIARWLDDESVMLHNAGNGCSDAFRARGPKHVESAPYFLYVGNFKDHKNPLPLFQAMAAFPEYDLVVVTSDVASATLLASECGLEPRLRIYSEISDQLLASMYRGCEALVFPSRWEGFGLPVLEALRCGAPVVYCAEADSVAEICRDTQYGVSRAGSPADFVQAMRAARVQPFRCPPGLEEYEWDKVARRVDEVIGLASSERKESRTRQP